MANDPNSTPQGISLSEFNQRITNAIATSRDTQGQWVRGEIIDMRVNRHCYFELIEKDDAGNTVARLGAAIWGNTFMALAAQFAAVTGSQLGNGMKVLVKISANFHKAFGIKAIVEDIDPNFTLGDLARQRREIIERLTREGVIDMNRELPWALVPQRIAVISAEGAAGYGDFMNQLENNQYRLKFYTHLFAATMQGQNTVPTVMAALDRINNNIELFDCVVLIRGGGASSDLNSFDNYDLAATIAQFPIPVIVGIGHERDVTVLDYVAAMRVKTPTAAAEFLIGRGSDALVALDQMQNAVVASVRDSLARAREQLTYCTGVISPAARRVIDTARTRLDGLAQAVPTAASAHLTAASTRLDHQVELLRNGVAQLLRTQDQRLQMLTDKVALLSPRNILNRGYSLTMCNGHFITDSTQLHEGDVITNHFKNGSVRSTVETIKD